MSGDRAGDFLEGEGGVVCNSPSAGSATAKVPVEVGTGGEEEEMVVEEEEEEEEGVPVVRRDEASSKKGDNRRPSVVFSVVPGVWTVSLSVARVAARSVACFTPNRAAYSVASTLRKD